MKPKDKLKGASKFGVKINRDSSLNHTSKTVLFPKKLELANKVVANLKWKAD
ncbi:hypothetical protein GCM10027164_23990 [Algoriphagus taiwanensis]|uniref:Uncharacterized protein n=1 Tax=Algoriphagus taiwanensis TaxID=1445656 RepID=A0ABQ6Q7I0_9BACT|nr:hypothetical protein Ataiwa_38030 [Algoriphagus taiwanensis]